MGGDNDGCLIGARRQALPVWHDTHRAYDSAIGASPLPSQIIPSDVECIRNMLHCLSRRGIILDQNDIKPAGTIPDSVLRQVVRRELG